MSTEKTLDQFQFPSNGKVEPKTINAVPIDALED